MFRAKFHEQPNVDPKTNETVKIGSKEYLTLEYKYGEPNKITSPKTGYKIAVNKGEYKKLISEGYTDDQLIPLVTQTIEKVKHTKTKQTKKADKVKETKKAKVPKIDKNKEPKSDPDISGIVQNLINNGNMLALHELSLVNKTIATLLSTEDNIKLLMHATNLHKYYKIDEISDFDELYFLYDTLNMRKKIYKYIRSTFSEDDFQRAVELGSALIGELKTYEAFMTFQREHLLGEDIDRKYLNFLLYIVTVSGGFGFLDKESMLPQFNDGMVFDVKGNMCLTMNR